ncbi:MAG: prepilin-type N-terminal cleavage/methylation domain-containing protein [Pseudomonadota bacterium]|nr:prepilin-type N-terminal cleavage/methylation domain-containing protein [Pseudomonadota bacterium]
MLTNMRKGLIGRSAGRDAAKRGFTLTEIAIVLGIVGLILGAIWVAAAAVYNNLRTSKATTELLTIVQNVRAMYATSSTVDPAATMPFTAVAVNTAPATYIAAGVFPADMVNAAGTLAQDPWNGSVAIVPAQSAAGTANDSFMVAFDRVPQQACVNMITSNTGSGRDPQIIGVSNAAAGTVPAAANATAFPVLAGTALATNCTVATAAGQSIGFTFKLK